MYGRGYINNASSFSNRCPDLSAGEGQTSDSLLSTDVSTALFLLITTSLRPRSLTDPTFSLNEPNTLFGFFTGLLTVMVSGLSLTTKPPRENKLSNGLQHNLGCLFTSSRYSLAPLGLQGDQT
jgi:hypothetical protein